MIGSYLWSIGEKTYRWTLTYLALYNIKQAHSMLLGVICAGDVKIWSLFSFLPHFDLIWRRRRRAGRQVKNEVKFYQRNSRLSKTVQSPVTIKVQKLRLLHTSRFFVVKLQTFCRGQIGLKFVRTSACRTLADFLSRLTAFSLGAESISAMYVWREACSRDSHDNYSLVEVRASPDKLSWSTAHYPTILDNTFWDLAQSDIARQAPILSQTCLNSPHNIRQVKSFRRPRSQDGADNLGHFTLFCRGR